jgi:hypothetical protein
MTMTSPLLERLFLNRRAVFRYSIDEINMYRLIQSEVVGFDKRIQRAILPFTMSLQSLRHYFSWHFEPGLAAQAQLTLIA